MLESNAMSNCCRSYHGNKRKPENLSYKNYFILEVSTLKCSDLILLRISLTIQYILSLQKLHTDIVQHEIHKL